MKIVLKGWIGRSMETRRDFECFGDMYDVYIYLKRGIKRDWNPEDWPPRRVTVTIDDGKEES